MKLIRHGCTRQVLLTKCWAFKVPYFYQWDRFLRGLLANMQEVTFGRGYSDRLCPVRFWLPGGFLVVMPRCLPLAPEEILYLENNDSPGFRVKRAFSPQFGREMFTILDDADNHLPVEMKDNSFGWLDDRIVALDYGS